MIAATSVESEGMTVTPVARDELVFVSADPERLSSPMTAARLARAALIMPETTWRSSDSVRSRPRSVRVGACVPTQISTPSRRTSAVAFIGSICA